MQEAWEGFKEGIWTGEVDVRDFIQKNYTPYEGDESFLAGPTERTKELWGEVLDLLLKEREQGGVLDMDTKTVTGIVSHPAGYIDNAHREKETIVGLQTDKPLKRALHVNGGIRIACQAASQHGYKVDENVVERYTFERKTHNAGVFDVYTPEMRACRSAHIITGLPDGYGRGRIIGDYRRVALYGVDYLIKDKEAQKASTPTVMTADNIRDREELQEQIRALGGHQDDGRDLRFRYFQPCYQHARRPSSGCTSPILLPSRPRTAPLCPSAVPLRSSTSISSATWTTVP